MEFGVWRIHYKEGEDGWNLRMSTVLQLVRTRACLHVSCAGCDSCQCSHSHVVFDV